MSAKIGVLIVDDEAYVRDSLTELLRAEGMRTAGADGAPQALELLARQRFDVIVTDLRMPSGDGLRLLAESRAAGVEIPILVISGVGTVADAVAAMKAGAFDFLQKPVDPDELALLVRRAARHRELAAEVQSLRRQVARLEPQRRLVGLSPAMARVRQRIEQVAPTDSTVLVRGESGTGKELVAAEIHRRSARAAGPYVVVDCAALSDEGFEAEFCGAQRGAHGRLQEAEGGTLVLDNAGALRPGVQSKLLRLLETRAYQPAGEPRGREADVRWITTTSDDLRLLAKDGAFRPELLFRLEVFPIDLPPLRDRREDLPELATHLLVAARARLGGAETRAAPLDAEALDVLASYGWPGNVRELRNVLERAAILAQGGAIDAALLRDVLEIKLPPRPVPAGAELNLRWNLDRLERDLVLRAIAKTRGRKREACDLLGIDARNLGYYLRKHRIRDEEVRQAAEG
jgi:two-component system response regulator FlrC